MLTRVIRQIHMYLALFLMPWMLIYAVSTVCMNHRQWVSSLYSEKSPAFSAEKEVDYKNPLPDGFTPEAAAKQILQDMNLEGAHNVRGGKDKPLVITRLDPLGLKRLTYKPAEGKILIEQEEFRTQAFLERIHRRRGYQHDSLIEDTWGFSVDFTITAIIFWCLSGIWIWWELKITRKWGTVCLASGSVLFVLFLWLI